jgi:predicted DNA-binding transcriptional regulator YafY
MPARKSADSLIPQAKLLRLFQIIATLRSGRWTVDQLAERFDTSTRTVYRYLKLLEEVNFQVEKDFEDRYFIITSDDDPASAQFTIEETRLIRKLIQSGAKSNPLKNLLLRKLAFHSELDRMPRLFLDMRIGKFVERITEALRAQRQVVLKNYHSANSSEVRDRLVEPIQFGDNYASLLALDVGDKICKHFKLERIGEVLMMPAPIEHAHLHTKREADIFGFAGDAEIWVTLRLSLRAYLLLREEFPLSIQYTNKDEEGCTFHGPVSGLQGIGRFVMGLLDEVTVVEPKALKEFIQSKVNLSAR